MDHGQFERKSRVMSHVPVEQVDLCDNLPHRDAVTAQTRNLNNTNTLQQSLSPSENEEAGRCRLFPKKLFNNNGKDEEEEQGKEEYFRRGREQDEEEDIDEVMREEEEEEESEESSSAIHCQSPDTPMTDSSYSETGSLLETPCPFSPGTSPETSSPDIPVMPPETQFPTSPVEIKQSSDRVDSRASAQTVVLTTTSVGKNTDSTTAHLTSSSESFFNHGPATSYPGLITSTRETFTVTTHTRRLNPSISTTDSATSGHLASVIASTTEPTSTGTESMSSTGLISSTWEHVTSFPTGSSASTWQTGTIPALLESLQQLAQRGDDSHLPHYLHQIAEAFVLHGDYQRALWCLQLERLYHQRVLENLSTLQEQWENQCKRTSCDLTAQPLDTLKHICQTHSRPSAEDAVCGSLDFLRLLPSYLSAHRVDRGTAQTAVDSSCSQSSDPVISSSSLPDRLRFIENLDKYRKDLDRESNERDVFHGSQLTDEQVSDREGGEAEGGVGRTISAIGNGLHPSPAGEMDQSEPAKQQGGDRGLAEGKGAEREEEEKDAEKTVEDLGMEDEGEEEEKEKQKQKERGSVFCQKALPVDTLVSGAEVEVQQLHQEARADEKLLEDTEDGAEAYMHQEAHPTHEAHIRHEEQLEEEEDEDYEVEQADIIREGALLDHMAKLISVEEMSPAPDLVSILKKRSVCVDNLSVSVSPEHQPDKATAKRRVRFKVPDDDEQDVGSSDSCLLLFLLCLVTVVISVGGTALYCALGDAHSSVCEDFSRNADFYIGQIQRGITHVQHWYTAWS